jgi:hypothetical protein
MGPAVGGSAVDLAIEHNHFPVHPVEGAQAEVPMAEHLADGRRAVVAAGQQAGNGGHLIRLGGARGRSGRNADGKQKYAPKHLAKHRELLVVQFEVRKHSRHVQIRTSESKGRLE